MTVRRAKTAGRLSCQVAFQQIARSCLVSVRKHRAAACRGDPDAIHDVRIALTRLRAARKFFASMTRDTAWPSLKAEIRWLNSALGAARDNDVTTAYARTLQQSPLAVEERERLDSATARTHRQLASALRSARCDKLLASLARWIEKGPWLTMGAARRRMLPLADYAPARLQRWKRRLARKAARGWGNGRRRHRLRIATKRYRYMRESLTAIGMPEGRLARRDREAAHVVQRSLGEIRDLNRFQKLQPASLSARSYRRHKKHLLRKAANAFGDLG